MYSSLTDKKIKSSSKDHSTVLTQVFKNPHCALCNGVPVLNTRCWVPLMEERGVPSLAIVIDFVAWKDENQQHR
jgi:hypothetical protein